MKKSVRIVALLLIVLLLASIAACGPKDKLAKVTFVFGEGINNHTEFVFVGDKTSQPSAPENNGKTIVGWYLRASFAEDSKWNFNVDRVQENVTLYAKWQESSTPDPKPDPTPTPKPNVPFESFGMKVIDVYLSELNVKEDGIYTSMKEVGAYIYLFGKLPSNFHKKSTNKHKQYTTKNKYSAGGDAFYNKEGLLPKASGRTYTECDIDYTGGGRNSKRIVFSSDGLIFYTSDHYESFSILRFHENNS